MTFQGKRKLTQKLLMNNLLNTICKAIGPQLRKKKNAPNHHYHLKKKKKNLNHQALEPILWATGTKLKMKLIGVQKKQIRKRWKTQFRFSIVGMEK